VLFSQALISTLTVGIAFLMYRCYLNLFCSFLAALLTALSPHLIVVNTYLLTETLFCFCLVGAAWWVSRVAERPSWGMLGILGGLLGAAYLIRPSLQIFPLVLALFMGVVFSGRMTSRHVTAFLVGFMVVAAPWFGRNLASLIQVSDSTLQVAFLHHGIYPDFMYNHQEENFGFPYHFDLRSAEIGRSTGSVLEEIKERFAMDPVEHAAWYFLKKPIYFWSWNIIQGQGDVFIYPVSRAPYTDDPVFVWSHRLMKWLHAPLVLLGLMGCVPVLLPEAARRLTPEALAAARFIALLLLFFTLIHMWGAPFPRYSVPLRPMIYGMALFAGKFFCDHLRDRRQPTGRTISAAGGR
jgi:hypothetical protein